MKIYAWNVNGLRAVTKKPDFKEFFDTVQPDVVCLQEIKAQEKDLTGDEQVKGYHTYFFPAKKRGYSGTAIYTKEEPLSITKGIGIDEFDDEGRVLTAEFEKFFVLSVYVVNVQPGLPRLSMRERFNDALLSFVQELEKQKPVIITGDFNVAHHPIDLKNDKANVGNPGFTDEERAKFSELLDAGFVDTFRAHHPDEEKYSWWTYRFGARKRNIGWRIDYVVVSKSLFPSIKESVILNEVHGSDHCPVGVIINE